MTLRLTLVIAHILLLAVAALARPPRTKQKPRDFNHYVFAEYPASDDGATFQVERGPCEDGSCPVIVRLLKNGREFGRETCADRVLSGRIEERRYTDLSSASWTTYGTRPEKDAIFEPNIILTVTPFVPALGSRAILCELWQNAGEIGPVGSWIAIGVVNGVLKPIWSEEQTESEGDFNYLTKVSVIAQKDGSSQLIFREDVMVSEEFNHLLNRYAIVAWNPTTQEMTQVPVYGVRIGEAEDKKTRESIRKSTCHGVPTMSSPAEWVQGSAFPLLKTSKNLVLALTSSEAQAKEWQQKLQSCRKSDKPPPILRLK